MAWRQNSYFPVPWCFLKIMLRAYQHGHHGSNSSSVRGSLFWSKTHLQGWPVQSIWRRFHKCWKPCSHPSKILLHRNPQTCKQAKQEQNKSNKWMFNISSIFYSFGNKKKTIVTTLQQTFCEYFSLYVLHFVPKWTVHPLINKGGKHSSEVRAVIKTAQLWILWWDTGPPPFAKILCVILGKSLCNSPVSMAIFSLHCLYKYLHQDEWILMFK